MQSILGSFESWKERFCGGFANASFNVMLFSLIENKLVYLECEDAHVLMSRGSVIVLSNKIWYMGNR